MRPKEACQILASRLHNQHGLERTPRQVFDFLAYRVVETCQHVTHAERCTILFVCITRLLTMPDQFELFAADVAEIGLLEEIR